MLLATLCSVSAAAVDAGELDDARVASKAFLEQNAKKEGVVSLPSGLQYRVLSSGNGEKPRAIDTVTLHYRGTTLDGREIDSSYSGGGPARMRVAETMPGWREALMLMQEGAKWELFIPPGLGYTRQRGSRYSRTDSLSSEALIFQLELLQVQRPGITSFASVTSRAVQRSSANVPHVFVYLMERPGAVGDSEKAADQTPRAITTESLAVPVPAKTAQTPAVAAPPAVPDGGAAGSEAGGENGTQEAVTDGVGRSAKSQTAVAAALSDRRSHSAASLFHEEAGQAPVISLPSGLKYRVLREGDGPAPSAGDTVRVHYRGSLLDGDEFDSSYRRGEPESLRVDEAIPAWQEALQGMKAGASWVLYVPPELGYRKPGPLAGQPLIFEIELLAVSAAELPAAGVKAGAHTTEPAQQLTIGLPGGLSYRVLRNGGGLSPLAGDTITVEFRQQRQGSGEARLDGDSLGQATFPLDWVIPAWRAVFARMEEGARWEVQVPPQLAHSAWGHQPEAPLALQVELLSVAVAPGQGIALAALGVAGRQGGGGPAGGGAGADRLIDLGEGIQYRVISPGTGGTAASSDTVTLRYSAATLPDARGFGAVYYGDGQTTLRLDQAMPVWQPALRAMRQGSRARFYLASQRVPAIWALPAGQRALLEVEMLAIEPQPTSP